MRRAYSYLRFSSGEQKKGDSRRRQLQRSQTYAEKTGLFLDDSLCLEDLGVSAFRGRNVREGAFAAFLEAIKSGRVAPGSVLLLESLDRLSRDQIADALELFLGILRHGITIVTFVPEREYTRESVRDIAGILEPIIHFARANDESATKSDRAHQNWERKRALAGERKMTANAPGWLRLKPDKSGWDCIPNRVGTVRLIYQWAREGLGIEAIARRLNQSGVSCVGRAKTWWPSFVYKLLTTRAVLGEYQPHTKMGDRRPTGQVIADYYPAILSEAEFYAARQSLVARKTQRGPKGKSQRNLFTGLIRDARDGCTMTVTNKGAKDIGARLVSSGAGRGSPGSQYRSVLYVQVEAAFLSFMSELSPRDILPSDRRVDEQDVIAGLYARITMLENKITVLKRRIFEEDDLDSLVDVLAQMERERRAFSAQLEKLKTENAANPTETLGQLRSLIDLLAKAKPEELGTLRTKLRARISQIVSEMWLLVAEVGEPMREWLIRNYGEDIVGHGRTRVRRTSLLQVFLRNGTNRCILLVGKKLISSHEAYDFMPPDIDLRTYRQRKAHTGVL